MEGIGWRYFAARKSSGARKPFVYARNLFRCILSPPNFVVAENLPAEAFLAALHHDRIQPPLVHGTARQYYILRVAKGMNRHGHGHGHALCFHGLFAAN